MIEGTLDLCDLTRSSLDNKITVTNRVNLSTALALGTALMAIVFSANLTAGSFDLCGAGLLLPARPAAEANSRDPEFTHVSADDADLVEIGTSVLTGNVQILKGDRQLQADRVDITQPQRVLDAVGNVELWDENLFVSGDTAHVELDVDAATLDQGTFILLDEHAHGQAERVVLSSKDLVTVEEAIYTTCNPDAVAWTLEADEIELDRVTEFGKARNALVTFKGVPIFYSPYLTFPLTDTRKTGFLTPSYRYSGNTGFEFHLPYYWNIAPERDATLTARAMTDRGVQIQGQYRYLSHRGDGQLGVEYLPDDSQFGADRSAFSFQHEGTFAHGWTSGIDVDWVSDKAYFEELGTTLAIASRRFLERRADVKYSGNRWSVLARVQDYQTIDRTTAAGSRPYKRLPQLLYSYKALNTTRTFVPSLHAEAVYFDRNDPSITGFRYDLKPALSYPIRTPSAFIIPKATVQYTGYHLDGQPAGLSDNPDRLLPILSTDAGLFFERDFSFAGKNFVQTLEPRLYYLYVPFDDQDDLPDFDTGERTFSFAQLFRENRFSGADRVGDANQLTLAVSSRLLTTTGEEWLRGSIGQIYYFRDRDVQLRPTAAAQTDGTSDIVGELSAKVWDDWRVTAGMQWNVDESRTDRNTLRLRYQPAPHKVVNVEYRFVRDTVEQTDLSFRWPLNHNWGFVGRWNYSLPESRTLEAFGGVEYESCCWATRAVVRRFLRNTEGDFDNGIFLQFELKGLAGIGESAATFLRKSIPGYQNDF